MNGLDFLLSTDSLAGAELYTLELAQACADAVDVSIAGRAGSRLLVRAAELGLETRGVELGPKLGRRTALENALRFRSARRTLREEMGRSDRWTVLQFKWEELLWGGEPAADQVCLIEHGPIPPDLLRIPWARQRLARAFSSAAVVCAVSDPAERSIAALCGRRPERLGAGIDAARLRRAHERAVELRAPLAGSSSLLVAYAGRLTRQKGVHRIVDLVEAFPDVAAVLVGDGPERAALERRAAANEGVTVAGHVGDAWPYLAAADVAVLLSSEAGEGRPLVGLESLALGTPVVGLAATPALQALAREFGSERVVLVPEAEPAVVRAALARTAKPTPAVELPTWDQVASEFLALVVERGAERVPA
jgi:glycosyltransferase involved in cell wall biosynthesis